MPPDAVQVILARSVEDCAAERKRKATGEQVTHAGLILDASSSMYAHRVTALRGFNAQVDVVKEGAKQAGRTFVSLNVFASAPSQVLSAVDADKLEPLAEHLYQPNGNTALYDAIGDTVALLLSQPGANDPNTAFLVAAFTDGGENWSSRYTGTLLKDLITRLEATGRWTFTLMGPKGGAEEMAGVLNIAKGNVAAFDPSKSESVVGAFQAMAGASESYMTMRSMGLCASNALYSSAGAKD
ncbi:vWA domain-containing protein [Burkholderia cenocepacia]|uniref:vWA domain-containing protein n=1 Tax=Burkholderia cenocepacia TaxID=95486 RepID=UPI0007616351|nr:vWA domain-containing protein [Burkholderia cenocepacia]KWU23342.1 hypothetical protein AS149_37350 [Burkholderia cenocepacia]